jgi:hypothetical protein
MAAFPRLKRSRRSTAARTHIRTSVVVGEQPAPAPALDKKAKPAKKPGANIHVKLRDLRKSVSPGARLAGFISAIFNGRRSNHTEWR